MALSIKCEYLIDKAIGYGMGGRRIDGNNLLEVYHTISELTADMRENPRPVLLECMTFRMRGHEEASGTKYVPQHLFDTWKEKDPVKCFENYLLEINVLRPEWLPEIKREFFTQIETEIEKVFSEPDIIPDIETELADMYKPYSFPTLQPSNVKTTKRYIDAISDGLRQAMLKHDN